MNNLPADPIRVGKAILEGNKLTVDGASFSVRHRDDFASFIQNTSAVVATALATVFAADTGELVFADGGAGAFKSSDVEPWQQYSAAVLGYPSNPDLSQVITGWCALLCLHSYFIPNEHVELKAIAFARYIASSAFKAAYATPEAVRRWDLYEEFTRTTAGITARLNGTDNKPEDPWKDVVDLSLPAPVELTHLTALTLVDAFGGDVVVMGGKTWASAGSRHFMSCVDDVSHVKRPGTFCATLVIGGVERRFRCQSEGDSFVVRLMAPALPKFDEGEINRVAPLLNSKPGN
jgi:hypothetical protein